MNGEYALDLIGTRSPSTPHCKLQCRPSMRERVNADPLEPDLLLQILEESRAATEQLARGWRVTTKIGT